ncbi:hypothetical protein N657DRAFT_647023 [Parathielavia appendiculata]|uniref:Uncharacterized protein n=1 Tax=Parathielavia appendiculata TaxID=2587402 RepID=A0AAN6TX35_9PEZI|nr:hypothetical protein N657DRAFT_647023 [Parathielavia appendiculata]
MLRSSRHPVTATSRRPRSLRGLFGTRHRAAPRATVTTTRPQRRGGLFHRTRPHHHHTTAAPMTVTHHHQKRRTSIGDKISGALLRLKGTITGRPGVKAAGTRRMHGTDGRGARRRRFL